MDSALKLNFSIGRRKNKSRRTSREIPPTNHTSSPTLITDITTASPSLTPSTSTISTPLPTVTHPLAELGSDTLPPNVREEARLEEGNGTEEEEEEEEEDEQAHLPGTNQSLSSSSAVGGGVLPWQQLESGLSKSKVVGEFLSAEDESSVRNFVLDFVGQKLLPHLEAVVRNLNEWVSLSLSLSLSLSPHTHTHTHTHSTTTSYRLSLPHSASSIVVGLCGVVSATWARDSWEYWEGSSIMLQQMNQGTLIRFILLIASRARLLQSQWQLCCRMYVHSGPGGPPRKPAMKKMVSAQHANVTGSLRVKGHVGTIM